MALTYPRYHKKLLHSKQQYIFANLISCPSQRNNLQGQPKHVKKLLQLGSHKHSDCVSGFKQLNNYMFWVLVARDKIHNNSKYIEHPFGHLEIKVQVAKHMWPMLVAHTQSRFSTLMQVGFLQQTFSFMRTPLLVLAYMPFNM